jgi:hypothetical protein
MSLPEYEDMEEPLLCFILLNGGDQHDVRADLTYEPLADFFALTREERTQPRPDSHPGALWHNRVQ